VLPRELGYELFEDSSAVLEHVLELARIGPGHLNVNLDQRVFDQVGDQFELFVS
jgi:hypothetical protein